MDLLSAELDLAERESQLESAGPTCAPPAGPPEPHRRRGAGELELVPEEIRVFDPAGLDDEALVAEALGEPPGGAGPGLHREREPERVHPAGPVAPHAQPVHEHGPAGVRTGGSSAFLSAELPRGTGAGTWRIQLSFPDLGQYFNIRNSTSRSRIQAGTRRRPCARPGWSWSRRSGTWCRSSGRRSGTWPPGAAGRALRGAEGPPVPGVRLGRGSYLELQNASEQAAGARRSALQAGYAFERARINLERALGRPLTAAELEG
jgi:hypothetical protein